MATHNLLDLMSAEDREKAISRFKERTARREAEYNKISSEVYIVAEFGFFYGWEGIQAIRRNEISLQEAYVLLEAARKVYYKQLLDQGRMTTTAVAANLAGKQGNRVYRDGMKDFAERAKL